jgi:RNA polymerase sigma factor (sigma-70 family)
VPPAWPLDRLMAWLHGVLHFVVLEEHNRASSRREFAGNDTAQNFLDRPDPAPDQLDALIQRELQQIVVECMPALDADYQRVLKMRANGLKYGDIAQRLGVSENTVATWVSRGIRTLAQCVRRRTQPPGIVRRMPD